MTLARELAVRSGDVLLAGTLWLPSTQAAGTVLMHPGSGPSDRHNDVFFPPIREVMLDAGFAVCSFDKRGVGDSTGRWQDAGILEQAVDLLACLASLERDPSVPKPLGLFGHSQGGWVVVEAAGQTPDIAFVVPNSGPGVTPGAQERHAHQTYLIRAGVPERDVPAALEPYDRLMDELRRGAPFAEVRPRLVPQFYRERSLVLFPDDQEFWDSLRKIFDYEPSRPLERIRQPVLALFGADDPLVPVPESVDAYRRAVRPELLTVEVFPGADHRIQAGDPPTFADGYFEALSSFLARAVA